MAIFYQKTMDGGQTEFLSSARSLIAITIIEPIIAHAQNKSIKANIF
jgi:hypothetical protein